MRFIYDPETPFLIVGGLVEEFLPLFGMEFVVLFVDYLPTLLVVIEGPAAKAAILTTFNLSGQKSETLYLGRIGKQKFS